MSFVFPFEVPFRTPMLLYISQVKGVSPEMRIPLLVWLIFKPASAKLLLSPDDAFFTLAVISTGK